MNILPYKTAHCESISTLEPDAGSTRTVDTTEYWEGTSSLKVVTTVSGWGAFFSNVGFGIDPSKLYSGSAYVKGSGNLTVTLKVYPSLAVITKTIELTSAWQRVECGGLLSGASDNLVRFVFRYTTGTGTFWIDGVQIEQGAVCTPFEQFLAGEPDDGFDILAEITAYTGSGTETLRYCTGPGVVVGGNFYEPRIINPGSIKTMLFSEGTTSGASEIGYGEVVLVNNDGGLDGLLNYGLDGRVIVLKKLVAGVATLLMSCAMEQPTVTMDEVAIRIKDPQALLDVPVQANKYAGTNNLPAGLEGTADIKGKEKPLTLGTVYNITPVMVNTSKLIFQVNDGAIQSIPAGYDKGVPLVQGTAYVSQADMEANPPATGQYRVWAGGGYGRLGSSSAGQFTCDVVEGATAADRTAAQIAKRLALRKLSSGELITQDFTDLDALNSAEVGIYITDGKTILAALDEVLGSIGGWWAFDADAKLNVGRLDAPAGTPALSLTDAEILSLERQATNDQGRGVPAYQVNLGYQKNWTVQDAGALAGRVTAIWKASTFTDVVRPWRSMTHGNGLFVAIGGDSEFSWVGTSPDGETWAEVADFSTYPMNNIAYGNGIFVVTCVSDAKGYTSSNGTSWTLRTLPFVPHSIAFGNGKFVATKLSGGQIAYSTDGISWTAVSTSATGPITYGNGLFVTTNAYVSSDGITWTAGTMPAGYWGSVAYGNGLFVALKGGVDETNSAATSTDGLTWALRELPVVAHWSGVAYGRDCFIAVAANSKVGAISADGVTWGQTVLPLASGWSTVGYGSGVFVAVTSVSATSATFRDTPDATRMLFVGKEYRSVESTDTSILTAHLNAAILNFNTMLVDADDAQAEADRRRDLYKVRRDPILVSCKRSALPAQLPVQGKVVQLTYPRFGYDAGKLFIFLGAEQHLGTDDVTLYLWG